MTTSTKTTARKVQAAAAQQTFTPQQQAERAAVAMAATIEIEAIGQHIAATVPPEALHLRALALRLLSLTQVVGGVLEETSDMDAAELNTLLAGAH